MKFYTSVRLDIRKIGVVKDTAGTIIGNHTRVKVVKNKCAAPFREAEFDICYAHGISWEGSVLEAAIKYNVVTKRGSWLSFDGEQIGQGQESSRLQMEKDKDLTARMAAKVTEKTANGGVPEAVVEGGAEGA